jgi:tRNA U34 5-methylaminomethyl-2-thiouridine-forming methyltransferase MnmC
MSSLKIITTHDGSHSLLHEQLNETYHSIHGAVQESNHVFIKHGLDFVSQHGKASAINLLEVGFGTGLNALLTLQFAHSHKFGIRYTTVEAFPVQEAVWSKLNYTESPDSGMWFEQLHRANWDKWINISPEFQLRKLKTTLQEAVLEQAYFDLIYFDAFAPSKQPEMWEVTMLKKVVDAMKPNGVLVTYCAKGQFKRDLHSLHLIVESLPGPPGKREMVRAQKYLANSS